MDNDGQTPIAFHKETFCVRLIHLHTLQGCTLEILVIVHSALQ